MKPKTAPYKPKSPTRTIVLQSDLLQACTTLLNTKLAQENSSIL